MIAVGGGRSPRRKRMLVPRAVTRRLLDRRSRGWIGRTMSSRWLAVASRKTRRGACPAGAATRASDRPRNPSPTRGADRADVMRCG